jgi:OOP family OmpA-OmpF porin
MYKAIMTLCAVGAGLALTAGPAEAQGWLDRAKKTAKDKIEQRVDQRTGEAIDKAIDGGEKAVKCAATDKECIQKAKAAGKTVDTSEPAAASENAESEAAAPKAARAKTPRPGEGAWLNYDFKPGERPLFVDDFSKDNIGDFPRRLELHRGNMEVIESQGTRWLRAAETGRFWIPLPDTLPERFTMEFDYSGISKYELKLQFHGDPNNPVDHVVVGSWGSGIHGDEVEAKAKMPEDIEERTVKVRVMADGRYVKVYVDSQRVANVPNANMGRTNRIHVELPAYGEDVVGLIANIRVMAGGRDLYDALAADGRVATQGIYFATGSDVIQAESTPTLKEIAAMLTEHGDLKLLIEGHTDNVGNAAANKTLSEQRAAAVKAYLVAQHGIDAARLETAGHGDAKPAAPNTTHEGRQQNRRVELVKVN